MRRQLQRRWNDCRAKLAKHARNDPVFPTPAHDAHDDVAFSDAEFAKGVSRLVGQAAYVVERETTLLPRIVAPQQRRLAGLDARPFVDDVIAEVERFGHVNLEVLVKVLVGLEFNPWAIFLQ